MNASVLKEIEGLRRLTVGGLRDKYREVFGEESRSNHKDFLFRRIAWRLQANAEGGLSERARRRALEIAKALPESVQLAEIEENMALLEAQRGQFHEAARTMELVIASEDRLLQPDDTRVARSLESYSSYLNKINQRAQARQAQDRAKAIRRTYF